MKAYLTTVGETTTNLCIEQLHKLGFEVIVLDGVEPWAEKYKRFIQLAAKENEICVRIDADIIPNRKLAEEGRDAWMLKEDRPAMYQCAYWDFYKNDIGIGNPVFYNPQAIQIILEHLHLIDEGRPETWASRLPQINPNLHNGQTLVGIHGFAQDEETMLRAQHHKVSRRQLDQGYDFNLAFKMANLCKSLS